MTQVKLKGSPVHLRGDLPTVGTKAPEFRLVAADLSDRTLKSFAGKKKLLSVVPSLDTAVCSAMTKRINEFAKAHSGVVFLTVSTDLPFAQKRFCSQEHTDNIQTLSMMRDKSFAKDYGVLIGDGPLEGICARALFVLDEEDKILHVQLVGEITEEPNYEAAMSHFRA